MEFTRTDIRNIAFEAINDRFSKGKYLGIEVTIDMVTGYINGNHLVGQVTTKGGIPKRFDNWRKTKEAQEMINYLESPTIVGRAATNKPLLCEVLDVPNELKGTYVDPTLVGHLAQWASPILAHKVLQIVKQYAIDAAIAGKDKVISSLEAKIDELLAEVRASRDDAHHMSLQLDNVSAELENTSISRDELTTQVAAIAVKLDVATDQRVPPARPKCNEVFAVYRNGATGRFCMIRRQLRTINAGIANAARNNFTEKVFYSDSPNAVNLGNRIKDVLPRALGTVTGTVIVLAPGKTTADLLAYINDAEREKKEV